MQFDVQSISYIDNREFPGTNAVTRTGPLGYQLVIYAGATSIIQNVAFTLSNWLADGFLVSRSRSLIQAPNIASSSSTVVMLSTLRISGSSPSPASCTSVHWVCIRIPLILVAPLRADIVNGAMGIMFVYQNAQQTGDGVWPDLSYFSISLSLNILLTLMIVIRLVLHARKTRIALGITGIGGLCRTIITILVESCALYAVSSLLVIGPLGAGNLVADFFLFVTPATQVRPFPQPQFLDRLTILQVIAPLLVILRVANKSALTRNTVASARASEFKTRTKQELAGGP